MRADRAGGVQGIDFAVQCLVSYADFFLPNLFVLVHAAGYFDFAQQLAAVVGADIFVKVHPPCPASFQIDARMLVYQQVLRPRYADAVHLHAEFVGLGVFVLQVNRPRPTENLFIGVGAALDRHHIHRFHATAAAHKVIHRVGGIAVRTVYRYRRYFHSRTGFVLVGRLKYHLGQFAPHVGFDVHRVAVDFAPPNQPAFLAAPPCADDDGQPVMLHVHAHSQNQAAARNGVFGIVFAAFCQVVFLHAVIGHFERDSDGRIDEGNHRRYIAVVRFVLRGQPFFHQFGKHTARERAV